MHWDHSTDSWKRYGTERGAARDAGITDEVKGTDSDTCGSPGNDSEAVSAASEAFSSSSEARANTQTPFSSYPTDSRVAAEGCDDGFAPQDTVADLETCSGTLEQTSSVHLPVCAP